MQTKNINHDYRSHQEIQQHHQHHHHPSCAAFRQATVPVGNSITISSHQNTCSGNTISSTNTTTNTCHHHHLKTTTTAASAASVAAISSDDSIAAATTSTETVLQVPTRTTHQQQQHNLGHCSSLRPTTTTTAITSTIISCNSSNTCSEQRQQVAVASRPMTGSQAALISPPLDSKTVAVVERSTAAPVAQVPQSRTFPRRDEDCREIVLFEDECYYGQDCQQPASTSFSVLQPNSVNMSAIQQQQRRNPVIGLSGSQPSLTGTLAAFVTGSNGSHHHHHQHFSHNHSHQHNQQPSGHQHNRQSCSHSPASQQSMLLTSTSSSSSAAVAANSKTPPHQQTRNTVAATASSSVQQSSRLLTTTTATAVAATTSGTTATTASDVAGQRRRCSSPQLATATTATTVRSTTFFSGSSTLPPNSTLSSLLAKGAGSFAANLGHSSHFEHQSNQSCSGGKLMKTMQQQQLSTTAAVELAAPLRRQASMSHLEKVAETKSKASLLHKGEAKLGSFQRLKAMLSSPKAEHKMLKTLPNGTSSSSTATTTTNSSPANTTSTYRPGEEIVLPPESSVDHHQRINGAVNGDVFGVRFSGGSTGVLANRPLSTLNKYTVSASSTNLSSSSSTSTTHLNHSHHHHHNYHPHHPQQQQHQQQQQQQAATTFSPNSTAETSFDEAGEDQSSFHLRNVCNKLFSQKQYSALHSSSVGNLQLQLQQLTVSPDSAGGVLSSVVQKVTSDQNLLAYRNITPDESGVEKVSQKETIYTAYGSNRPTTSTSANTTSSPSSHLLTSPTSFQHQLNAVPESSMEYHHNHHNHFHSNHQQYSSVNTHHHQHQHSHHDNQRNHVLQQQQQLQQQSAGGQHNEHVVVVSELSPKATPPSANGLTVRTQTPVGQQQQQTSNKPIVIAEHHRTVNGSTLSLNVASLGESAGGGDSVASHGDHESSESGRGTMNSHLEERVGGGGGHNSSASLNGHPMMNSPADLTSLDSDQSGENHHNHGHSHHHHHHQEAVSSGNGGGSRRPEPVLSKSGRNGSSSNYSTIQRYLDEQQRQQKASSAKQEADALCKDFQSSKLSLNDVTDDDSWTSISDSEPSTMKKRPTNGLLLPTKSTKKGQMLATAAAKGASRLLQQDSTKQQQLKTNFSKPENCLSPGSKQLSAKQILSSPAIKQKKLLMSNGKGDVDKSCIYSVPNKGKYLRGGNTTTLNPNTATDKMNGGPVNTVNAYSAKSPADQLDGGGSLDDLAASSDPESNFPDDGCSEFTDVYYQNGGGHHGHHGHHGQQQQQQPGDHDPLRKQLRGIEDMYSELLNMLNSKQAESALFQHQRPPRRTKLFRRNSGRSSVASRNTRDYISRRYRGGGGGDCRNRTKPDDLQLSRRYKKLESQVLTLAKSVSQLSADIQFNFMLNEEMESLRHEVEMLKSQMSNVKQNVASLSKSQQQVAAVNQQQHQQQQQLCTTLNRTTAAAAKELKKVDKLKRLFVDEPQPMKLFLKKLGYEKYCKHFEAEKIGLAELVHLNEERLQKLGLPMGPRLRLLQEAKNLAAMMNGTGYGKPASSGATGRDNGGGGGGKQSAPANGVQDSFNIYAVV